MHIRPVKGPFFKIIFVDLRQIICAKHAKQPPCHHENV
ncbi:MAG: hypothetical protein RLZZ617_1307 [Bacteroidota bacterium]|jgi:hypothetical protein